MYTAVVFVNDNHMFNCKYCDRSRLCTSYCIRVPFQSRIPQSFIAFLMLFATNPCLIYFLSKYAILAHYGYEYVIMVIPANSFVHDRFGTCCIGDNQMLRRACASTQFPRSLTRTFTARTHICHVIIHLADS